MKVLKVTEEQVHAVAAAIVLDALIVQDIRTSHGTDSPQDTAELSRIAADKITKRLAKVAR